ncbi:DNA gyrase inhibitor YacG [Paracoccus contaminans]|uniref:DNA gyrase inhibitor YacG n=1 Tax=Paracoccus contaminans TaxID=1945662 RepID=A0A1W6CXY3_9RHOB|nr:DNA gyrase inhibitor YacG [Paracoccus contaminans]ARJ69706.1 DNA gyrase inhibitor YacG [Paracoccus contaminans]
MRCPVCARPPDTKYRPFCSRRCADLDLARWLRGDYAIPGEPACGLSSDSQGEGLRERGE